MAIYQLFGSLVVALIWEYKETHSSFFFLIKNFLNREVKMSFSHEKQVDLIEIPSGKIGLVEAKKGENLSGNQFGKVVECKNFQDETAFINNGGQKGKQLSFLTAATYHINTEYFSVEIVDEIRINEDEIGLVRAKAGQPLSLGQHFGKVVECNNFQDAQAFISNGGQQGKQLAILTSNTYSINTWIFEVTIGSITKIPLGEIGLIIANDGVDMPIHRKLERSVKCKDFQDAQAFIYNGGESGQQLAILHNGKNYQINTELFTVITPANAEQYKLKPEQLKHYKVEKDSIGIVTTTEGKTGLSYGLSIEGHDNFQSPQKFIDAGGYKGLQEEVLLDGEYSLNPWFVKVEQVPITEIPINCIGILQNFFHGQIHHELENNNIYKIIPPGKFAINTSIYKVFNVPTNTVYVYWWDKPKNKWWSYEPLIMNTQDESKEIVVNLLLEFKVKQDYAYQFIQQFGDEVGNSSVVSHQDLIEIFIRNIIQHRVAHIYQSEILEVAPDYLNSYDSHKQIIQTATDMLREQGDFYYVTIEQHKDTIAFLLVRDRKEM